MPRKKEYDQNHKVNIKLDSESVSENEEILETDGEEVKEIDLGSTDGETTAASASVPVPVKEQKKREETPLIFPECEDDKFFGPCPISHQISSMNQLRSR